MTPSNVRTHVVCVADPTVIEPQAPCAIGHRLTTEVIATPVDLPPDVFMTVSGLVVGVIIVMWMLGKGLAFINNNHGA